MARIRARFDGRVFIPEVEVDLPAGAVVECESVEERPFKLSDLARTLPDNPDTPDDLAANLDHYLHGQPKRP